MTWAIASLKTRSFRLETMRQSLWATALCACAWLGHVSAFAADTPGALARLNLVPWPKSVQTVPGAMSLGPKSRIVYGDAKLAPLARVLSGEILQLTGTELATAAWSRVA